MGATRRLKRALGYLVGQLRTAEEEIRNFKNNEDKLRGELDAEQKQHAQTRESFSTSVAEIVHSLDDAKLSQTQLIMQHANLAAAKQQVDEVNCALQAKVARLTDTLADAVMNISAPAESHVIGVATGALGGSTPTSNGDIVGSTVSPAEESSFFSTSTAAKGNGASSLSAEESFQPSAEVPCVDESMGAKVLVGSSSPAESADPKAVTAGAADVAPSTNFSGGFFIGSAVSPAKRPFFSPATTASTGKVPSPLSMVTPSSPRAEVAPMSEPFSAITAANNVVASPPGVSNEVETVIAGVAHLVETASTSLGGSSRPAVSPADGTSLSPVAATAKGKAESSLLAATPSSFSADVARSSERFADTFPVGIFSPTESAIVATVTTDAVDLGASAATPSEGCIGPAVISATGISSSSSINAPKGKAGTSPRGVTPSFPGAKAAHPDPPSPATFSVGKVTGSRSTSFNFRQPTPANAKARNLQKSGDDPVGCPSLEFNPPPARKDIDKLRGTPRRYTHCPPTPVNPNSGGGKSAARAEKPAFSVRAAAKPYQKRSSTGEEVPSLALRGVTKKPALPSSVKRSSSSREVQPFSSGAGAKPGSRTYLKRGSVGKEVPSLAARAVAGSVEKGGSVGKGPAVEIGRGGGDGSAEGVGPVGNRPAVEIDGDGGARTGGPVKGKGPGDGRKVDIASSGRVLRSASRAAAAAAAAAPASGEADISAASGTVSGAAAAAAGAAPVQPTRSSRSGIRR